LSGSEEDIVWFDDTCLIVLHVAVMCVNLSANRYAVAMNTNEQLFQFFPWGH